MILLNLFIKTNLLKKKYINIGKSMVVHRLMLMMLLLKEEKELLKKHSLLIKLLLMKKKMRRLEKLEMLPLLQLEKHIKKEGLLLQLLQI